MIITFQQSEFAIKNKINPPSKAHTTDSGYDMFSPERIVLQPSERKTIDLHVKIAIPDLNSTLISMEAQIRPKSGRSKAGIDVELGTVDNAYRGFLGATVSNTSQNKVIIDVNEKLCQLVFAPVFLGLELESGIVDSDTDRGEKGFGATGLK